MQVGMEVDDEQPNLANQIDDEDVPLYCYSAVKLLIIPLRNG